MSTKNRTAEQQPATSAFLTKWLNKLTSLLSKRVREFLQPGSLKPAVGDNVRKKAYTSIKSIEEWTSRVLPSEQDDIVNSQLPGALQPIELQF